jgi:hypothetical protein
MRFPFFNDGAVEGFQRHAYEVAELQVDGLAGGVPSLQHLELILRRALHEVAQGRSVPDVLEAGGDEDALRPLSQGVYRRVR